MPKVLFIGDVVGRPGRQLLQNHLREIRQREGIDFVVANGENSAAGAGISLSTAQAILDAGVDGITLGDHVWDQRDFPAQLPNMDKVCRPANLPETCPGAGHLILEQKGFRLGVFTVLGREFMKIKANCPFEAVDRVIEWLGPQVDAILVEVHAETTSEKVALGWYLDGRVAVVLGTHTHVATADDRILPRGTAYITDVGMTGPHASVLGREIDPVIHRFLDGMPRKFPVASEDNVLNGFLVELDPAGRAVNAARYCYRPTMGDTFVG